MKVKKQKVSPRQKMINLMYVLLMAMLAMNVSSDVLNGFTLVDESLTRSTDNAGIQNSTLYSSLGEMMSKNPEKAIFLAVKGMLPKNTIGRKSLTRLKVYAGEAHQHAAQQPQSFEF